MIVSTPTIRHAEATGRKRILLNRHQHSARRGLIVSGLAGTGKTTAITQLGKNYEQLGRRRGEIPPKALPVVYVTVPPAAAPKMLAIEFARFIGLPLPSRYSQVEVTNRVCDLLCTLGCRLVLIDELHNLDIGTRVGAEASDQIKYLSERIPATFVLAGVDVEGTGLFAGRRGGQIASRYSLIPNQPVPAQDRGRTGGSAVARRDAGGSATAARAPAGHLAQTQCLPARPHGRRDRQPVPPRPGGSPGRHARRHGKDHTRLSGACRPGRERRAAEPPPRTPAPRTRFEANRVITGLRVLPFTPPPVSGETIGSYLNRLADANHLTIGHLSSLIGPGRRYRRDDNRVGYWTTSMLPRLAALTGRSVSSLVHAMPPLGTISDPGLRLPPSLIEEITEPGSPPMPAHRRFSSDGTIDSTCWERTPSATHTVHPTHESSWPPIPKPLFSLNCSSHRTGETIPSCPQKRHGVSASLPGSCHLT
ncbi:TniB family NTP-binding protein [Streptomyces sp. NPDC007264]|uniref:TniB family NTP-binding protein n=1 Tax=Streptomyces sp. NPDC007264 TaxID=3364777 RepID=UPI0036DBDF50